MSHTPGPWHRNIKPATKYPTIFASLNTHIAVVKTEAMSPEEVEANINLLSAAPELLEALEMMVSTMWGLEPATTSDGCYTNDPKERQARSAIRKARGES